MATTARFGLETFGGSVPGTLQDKGGKFTGRDRRTIDAIMAALEAHDHSGGDPLPSPVAAPGASLIEGSGALPGGVTYHYRVSYVDKWGLETAAGPAVSVATAGQVSIPGAPGLNAVSGGSLSQGLHQYGLTAISDSGETPLGSVSTINLSDWRTVEVSMPTLPSGATQISVWRQGPADSGYTRIATVPAATGLLYTDDGSVPSDDCACDPSHWPPLVNSTSSQNAVRITIPSADVAIPTDVSRWRIYRTTTSGSYPVASLVAEVANTTTEINGEQLVNEYVDQGSTPLLYGQPLEKSQAFDPTPPVAASTDSALFGPTMVSDGTDVFRLVSSIDGQLETVHVRTLDTPGVASGFRLTDAMDVVWHVTCDSDGILITTTGATTEDPLYEYGEGPSVPTPEATITWQVEIEADGALRTIGQREVSTLEQVRIRESAVEPPAPESGSVLFFHGGSLKAKDSAGAVTVLA